ncbi:S28 family serine protease [Streptomyces jumonjinensis]|uniref:Aminopeptidase n=1 Tax=Streptomyces jumonjinensis TaxID=1945 RepID=A0A646KCD8_STRJU|nr:S28 family serine protease [Streptomyces jumonjinensis]MQS99873.1 aminopeptidase [Streptomyces jumonjinensis]
MRKALTGVLSLAMLAGTATAAGATTTGDTANGVQTGQQAAAQDIKARILAIPGMSLIEEKPHAGYRYFVLNYKQPIDHRNPEKGTFKQRLTLLHKDTSRPTVFYTSGYSLYTEPFRSEPTTIVDGNQVAMEYRFFTPSRPKPADWSKLDIWQAASDQHRIYTALKKIYDKNWIATGGSKGGMTATYFERFYPKDMDGVVAYVAPNDVANDKDAAYDEFFRKVGTKECRTKLDNIQREALIRRTPLKKIYKQYAKDNKFTFKTVGSLDKAYEAVVLDYTFAFWQYSLAADCKKLPTAKKLSDLELMNTIDKVSGFSFYTDQGLTPYTPYYYQAGTELGAPDMKMPHLKGLTRYGYQQPRNFVPRDIKMRFKPDVMAGVDKFVREKANRMMFVNGQNDPWSSEPFRLGKGSRDSYVYTVPGGNHGSDVAGLSAKQEAAATASILEWAGVAPTAVRLDESKARPLAKPDAKLDKVDIERERGLRP